MLDAGKEKGARLGPFFYSSELQRFFYERPVLVLMGRGAAIAADHGLRSALGTVEFDEAFLAHGIVQGAFAAPIFEIPLDLVTVVKG